jgi:chaperone BCS1
MDLHVEFELASKHQAKELYRRFYSPDREITGEVTAQAKEDEKDELSKELFLIDLDEPRLDATGGTSAASPSAATQQLLTAETHDPKPDQLAVLSKPLLDRLATAFSDTLPEREFSMAALQGYLMMYKSEPMIAVREFVTWIEQERRDKQGRERREKEEKNTVRAKAKEGDNAGKELPFKGIQPAT